MQQRGQIGSQSGPIGPLRLYLTQKVEASQLSLLILDLIPTR